VNDDHDAASPPEQAETEQGFGSGLRAQLARSQEAREEALRDEEPASPLNETATPAPLDEGTDLSDAEREISDSLARGEELRRSLAPRYAKLAEWVASQGRELASPEAAALLASGSAEAELERRRAEAAELERRFEELTEREAALAERERRAQIQADAAGRDAAAAERRLQSALEREAELDVRARRLETRETELEAWTQRLDDQERELREREGGLEGAESVAGARAELDSRSGDLAARERELDERTAGLDSREQRLAQREDALGELKEWLVSKERDLAAYMGEAAEPAG
jgi:hypothetical protein